MQFYNINEVLFLDFLFISEDDLCQYGGFQNGLSEADELIKDLPNLEVNSLYMIWFDSTWYSIQGVIINKKQMHALRY